MSSGKGEGRGDNAGVVSSAVEHRTSARHAATACGTRHNHQAALHRLMRAGEGTHGIRKGECTHDIKNSGTGRKWYLVGVVLACANSRPDAT